MSQRIRVDVVVIGAGPAGSTAAEHAALGGTDVLVLERRPVIGEPVKCGEFMPHLEEMQGIFPKGEDLAPLFEVPGDLRSLETDVIRIFSPSLRHWDVPFSGYSTDRNRFDQHLARRAEKAGARFMLGTTCLGIDGNVVRADGLEVEAKVVIGADGPLSRVGKSVGLGRSLDLCPAVTVQVNGDFEPVPEMYFGTVAPGGYAWVIPKRGAANVGLGVAPRFAKDTVGGYFDRFMKMKGLHADTPITGKFVPMSGPIDKAVKGQVLLVGDAAGQVMAVNGGGIPIAMITGRFAGRTAAANVKLGTPLEDYERSCRRQVYGPLRTAVRTKHLANLCFGSKWRTDAAMRALGQRRINKLIRCKPVLP
jgi:digeranylgeranylglycerophospholipid reductase